MENMQQKQGTARAHSHRAMVECWSIRGPERLIGGNIRRTKKKTKKKHDLPTSNLDILDSFQLNGLFLETASEEDGIAPRVRRNTE